MDAGLSTPRVTGAVRPRATLFGALHSGWHVSSGTSWVWHIVRALVLAHRSGLCWVAGLRAACPAPSGRGPAWPSASSLTPGRKVFRAGVRGPGLGRRRALWPAGGPLRRVSWEADRRGPFHEHLVAQVHPRGPLNQAAQGLGTRFPNPETPWPEVSPGTLCSDRAPVGTRPQPSLGRRVPFPPFLPFWAHGAAAFPLGALHFRHEFSFVLL